MAQWEFAILFIATIGSGIVGGIFYAFSSFVMEALTRLPPAEGVAAMKSINIVVINASFMTAFLGTAALCVLVLVALATKWISDPRAGLASAGAVIYLIGSIVVTLGFNVPLNGTLARLASQPEAVSFWPEFVTRWMWWNHVRCAASLLAMTLFIAAISVGSR